MSSGCDVCARQVTQDLSAAECFSSAGNAIVRAFAEDFARKERGSAVVVAVFALSAAVQAYGLLRHCVGRRAPPPVPTPQPIAEKG